MNVLHYGIFCVTIFVTSATGFGLEGFDVVKFEKTLKKEAGKVRRLLDVWSPKNGFKPVEIFNEWKSAHSSKSMVSFSWKNCSKAGDMILVRKLTISPDPIRLPGTLSVGFAVDFHKEIASPLSVEEFLDFFPQYALKQRVVVHVKLSEIQADLLLERKVGSKYIKIKCKGFLGSCHYPDVCQILSLIPTCPPEFVQRGIPCKCPIQTGKYVLPDISFNLNFVPLESGDYHAKMDFSYLGAHVGCLEMYLSIVAVS